MPSLAEHQSNSFTKVLLLGDAKVGKTGSLVSLVKVGYKLRILDLDNLLDFLKGRILAECPDYISNVEFKTLRDKRKMTPQGPIISGPPKAFVDTIKMLDRWKYDDVDLGVPAEWGPDTILVLDSLSRFCDAAYDWADPLVPEGKGGKDARAVYGMAQDAVESTLATLTGELFRTNVIVIAHGQYMELPDGTTKIFPQGVGQKLSPKIPQYFPTYIRFKNINNRRVIQTVSDPMIDLANPNPAKISKEYPVETGLAEIFEALREPAKEVSVQQRRA